MSPVHPVRALYSTLEATRLRAVETMAGESIPSPEALRDLASLQAALTAVREVIGDQSGKLGWSGGGDEEGQASLEPAAEK